MATAAAKQPSKAYFWEPQAGPQAYAAICPCDETFFGGHRGGGKTDCLWGRHLAGSDRFGRDWNGLVARRNYKDFAELRRRVDGMIDRGLPAERVGGEQQTNIVKFHNGATVTMVAIQRLEQLGAYQGHQYTEISIDEAPLIPFLQKMIDQFKGCLRSPAGVPCRMFMTGNPGGPGANVVKMRFITPAKSNTIHRDKRSGESRVFIPSRLQDNKILCQNDPKYVSRLMSISDPALRKAWLEGNWDVFLGQAFDFSRDYHVVSPYPIPNYAPIYMTFDWGFGKPFSIGWWFADKEGRITRFAEWYGWDGEVPDNGLRLADEEIVLGTVRNGERIPGIKEREKKLGIKNHDTVIRIAGPDCWNKKPDYKGGGQGPSTAEKWAHLGIYLTKGDADRKLKLRQFRERLRVQLDPRDNKTVLPPMMLIFETCEQFIRTVPALCTDPLDIEDIDTEMEDHIYDEACHICMARPMKLKTPEGPLSDAHRHIEMIENTVQQEKSFEGFAVREQAQDRAFWDRVIENERRDITTSDLDGY